MLTCMGREDGVLCLGVQVNTAFAIFGYDACWGEEKFNSLFSCFNNILIISVPFCFKVNLISLWTT